MLKSTDLSQDARKRNGITNSLMSLLFIAIAKITGKE
jgi:hypothetical protein